MNLFTSSQPKKRVLHSDENAVADLRNTINSLIPKSAKEIVVVCIGTDRSTGDSFGPLVGLHLSKKKFQHVNIYGTIHDPVHALNLKESVEKIELAHPNAFVIAIDACLGKSSSIGFVNAEKGASKPGAALNKELPSVGDMHIHGIVNLNGFMEFFVLQNTRLSLVMNMADMTASALSLSLSEFDERQKSKRYHL